MSMSRAALSALHAAGATALAASALLAGPASPASADPDDRRVAVTVVNETSDNMYIDNQSAYEGEWTTGPDDVIEAWNSDYFSTQSDTSGQGTSGAVSYSLGSGTVYISWNNPYSDPNEYDCSAPYGYECSYSSGGTRAASVTFTIEEDN